jgi:hypothetical protein
VWNDSWRNGGILFFDTNNNSIIDADEPSQDIKGQLKCYEEYGECDLGTIKIPNVAPGTYNIRYLSPSGVLEGEPDQYVVKSPYLYSSKKEGGTNTAITIQGEYFNPEEEGTIYFDSNNNSQLDLDEPNQLVTINGVGRLSGSVKVPILNPGIYSIRYQSSTGKTMVNAITYTVMIPYLQTPIKEGGINKSLGVSGYALPAEEQGAIFFDSNANGQLDNGESKQTVIADQAGYFIGKLTIPNVLPGLYNIYYISPTGKIGVLPVQYKVIKPYLNIIPAKGVANMDIQIKTTHLPANDQGILFFDNNKNKELDVGEPSINLKTTSQVYHFASLKVPDVKTGVYEILYISSLGEISFTPGKYQVMKPTITTNPVQGITGGYITVKGAYFNSISSGKIYFDSNNNKLLAKMNRTLLSLVHRSLFH